MRRYDLSSRDEPKPMTILQFVNAADIPWLSKLCLAAVLYFCKIFGGLHLMKPVTIRPPEPPE